MGVWFQLVRDFILKIFCYKKRQFRHARNIQVWFGRKQMRLSNVLEVVAKEFNASPMQIHQVLNDLDFLISDAQGITTTNTIKNNKI
ncbi:Ion_trans_2 domain-containing protein [Meloidogyne graminicola]|uniref:Ion_trans_2 domain-containing protein n=1 Tax=Meloidogyne graminicola TaxID=189291 RepID=A0A8S9ZB56_9BILA|nr:Ion_trans_2 domain-containing protein [Meloidogyne graminicola]